MCMSIRGGTYYGASVHISVALLYLGGFFIDLLNIYEVWHNPYATYFSLILAFLYICLFLMFGLLIFRGVEMESPKLIKGAVAGFLVLQMSAFVVYLALLALTNTRKNSELIKMLLEKERLKISNSNSSEANNPSTFNLTLSNLTLSISKMSTFLNNSSEEEEASFEVLLEGPIVPVQNIPIITLFQIISLVLGILATFLYVATVVTYVRSISSSRGNR